MRTSLRKFSRRFLRNLGGDRPDIGLRWKTSGSGEETSFSKLPAPASRNEEVFTTFPPSAVKSWSTRWTSAVLLIVGIAVISGWWNSCCATQKSPSMVHVHDWMQPSNFSTARCRMSKALAPQAMKSPGFVHLTSACRCSVSSPTVDVLTIRSVRFSSSKLMFSVFSFKEKKNKILVTKIRQRRWHHLQLSRPA